MGVFVCLSLLGLPAVRARVLGLLKGELDARHGREQGRSIIRLKLGGFGSGWRFMCFLFSVWGVR